MLDLLDIHAFTGRAPEPVRCADCGEPISGTYAARTDGTRICALCVRRSVNARMFAPYSGRLDERELIERADMRARVRS
jgi:recombinational DNA repair protein (RecF pathway)